MFIIRLIKYLWRKFHYQKYYKETMQQLNEVGLRIDCLASIVNNIENYEFALGTYCSKFYTFGFCMAYFDYINKIQFDNKGDPKEIYKAFVELLNDCKPFLTDNGLKIAHLLINYLNKER